ncbi:MAG TPA: sugar ABC transporter permease [Chloroflexota bacterium]|nr:sugar ABC transporter permease [Chloroflexota bacterium]
MATSRSQIQRTVGAGGEGSARAGARRALTAEAGFGYLFVAPLLLLIVAFIYWPLLYSAYLSLYDWNFVSPDWRFVGASNYTRLPDDPRFRLAVWQTVVYVLALVPIKVFLPLGLALLLWPIRRSRAQGVYRLMLFTPTVISFAVAALVWLWIFNPLQGVLNQMILGAGGSRINWLSNPQMAIWCVIIVSTWKVLGFNLLLYLAALEAVPDEYVEAGSIDGAGGWHLLRYIRWPLITPTFFFILVTTVIFVNDEVFSAISVLTDGGPFDRSINLVFYLYQQAFRYFQIGMASAVAIILSLAVMLLTWLQFRFVERHVHYG